MADKKRYSVIDTVHYEKRESGCLSQSLWARKMHVTKNNG